MRARLSAVLAAVLMVTATGRAGSGFSRSTPQKPGDSEAIQFAQSLPEVRKAAESALTVHGFELNKQQPLYVEGVRPQELTMSPASASDS